jgi:hypothetical protein
LDDFNVWLNFITLILLFIIYKKLMSKVDTD